MLLQLSPSINSSTIDHHEHRYLSLPKVKIPSLTDNECAIKRNAPIRLANRDLAAAIAGTESHATRRHDYFGGDRSGPICRPTPHTLHVRIQESVFYYFDSLSAPSNGHLDVSVPRKRSAIVAQLSKVLRTAGIDIRKLDRSAENAIRLAIVASVVETLLPTTLPETGKKSAVPALSKWRLMRVLTYIDANIGEPITLANLSATAGLSRMYFARQFRTATGIRPHEYVLRKRIERAQQMLAETSDALVDVALSVGFQTQAHFTTVFKRVVGNTPCQWRREQANVA
jgi:AraC family transcriptional regulator